MERSDPWKPNLIGSLVTKPFPASGRADPVMARRSQSPGWVTLQSIFSCLSYSSTGHPPPIFPSSHLPQQIDLLSATEISGQFESYFDLHPLPLPLPTSNGAVLQHAMPSLGWIRQDFLSPDNVALLKQGKYRQPIESPCSQ